VSPKVTQDREAKVMDDRRIRTLQPVTESP